MKKIVVTALALGALVLAQESEDKLLTHTELGYVNTQGNTQTTALSLDAKAKKGWEKHIVELSFDGQYATDKDIESKNKYLSELSYDYETTQRLSYGYLIGYKQDKFSGFDQQFYTGPGAKYKAIKTPTHQLSLEANILYAQDELVDTNYDAAGNEIPYPNSEEIPTVRVQRGETNSYASYRTKAQYEWKILEHLKFSQELSYRSEFTDSSNYFVFCKTALTNKITDIFSAGVNYKIDYANLPSNTKERADRTFSANFIMDF